MGTISEDFDWTASRKDTKRKTVILGLAVLLNVVLLVAPLFVGWRATSAVAATANAPAPAGDVQSSPAVSQPRVPAPVENTHAPQRPARSAGQPVKPNAGTPVAIATSEPAPLAADSSSSPVEFSLPPAPMPDFDPCVLEISNPPETNGPVHFVVEGLVYSLEPGETHQWVAFSQREVEFHRGDDYGNASYAVERGTWRFQIGDAGWELVPAEHVSTVAAQP